MYYWLTDGHGVHELHLRPAAYLLLGLGLGLIAWAAIRQTNRRR